MAHWIVLTESNRYVNFDHVEWIEQAQFTVDGKTRALPNKLHLRSGACLSLEGRERFQINNLLDSHVSVPNDED